MSTTGSAVDALMREAILNGRKRKAKIDRPKKPFTKALVRKLEKELKG